MGRRLLVFVATVASLVALTGGSALATVAGTLDQHQDGDSWNNLAVAPGMSLGQTFKAGLSGSLVKVSVEVSLADVTVPSGVARPAASGSVEVDVTSTTGGSPDTVLATETATLNDGWNDVIFGSPHAVVSWTRSTPSS